jgi:hypothetical protein
MATRSPTLGVRIFRDHSITKKSERTRPIQTWMLIQTSLQSSQESTCDTYAAISGSVQSIKSSGGTLGASGLSLWYSCHKAIPTGQAKGCRHRRNDDLHCGYDCSSCGWKLEPKGLCLVQREAASEETARALITLVSTYGEETCDVLPLRDRECQSLEERKLKVRALPWSLMTTSPGR